MMVVYPIDDLYSNFKYVSDSTAASTKSKTSVKNQVRAGAGLFYFASPLVDGSGYSYDFSVPGLTKSDVEVEVFRESDWSSNSYSLRVKTLKDNVFTPKTVSVVTLEPNLDVSTASTVLVDGVLSVVFKYDAKTEKRNYKLEVK